MPTIKLNRIAKIYGQAELSLKIKNKKVEQAKINILEGARFFEGILQGRNCEEVGEINSRICGTCSAAHHTASLKAIEQILKVRVSRQTQQLRELLNVGAIIQNHALHLYFFALPDYYGFESAIAMASKHKHIINAALKLKRIGNEIVSIIGGREIHSISAVIGGFSILPEQEKLDQLLDELKRTRKLAIKTAELFSKLKYPELARDPEHKALVNNKNYAVLDGRIGSNKTKAFSAEDYRKHLYEYTKPYSTSRFVTAEKPYSVGSMARVILKGKFLSHSAKRFIPKLQTNNPFYTNLARAIELVHFYDRAIELIEDLKLKEEKPIKWHARAGRAIVAIEAPRGILFHEYELNKNGTVKYAKIITPTAQNLKSIEEDVKALLPQLLELEKPEIIKKLEMLIRAYDPCISCSTHFLEIEGL